ncbi:MAG: NapC/NirT family cytochrome c [Burkholderiales bacterium]|uniref:NapC/NirT family cytochrome c n=1 Tax=Inhella sp. TaxID=1921806 RepID=UPI001AC89187|nr:NapC/NirT family cytochrome c [Burkholderiales bacterium]
MRALLQWLRQRASLKPIWWLAVFFAGGIIFWGGFNTAMEWTNREAFCISCHEMEKNVFVEYRNTIHYQNRTGVRATCPDCHVPKEWGPKMVRKIQASKELLGKMLGTIDTPEKFNAHRGVMAEREWSRMKANDSQECRNCHNFSYMDYAEQNARAATRHQVAFTQGQTCIDCHKGIAHTMPPVEQPIGAHKEGEVKLPPPTLATPATSSAPASGTAAGY